MKEPAVAQRVTCIHCRPARSWWTARPRSSLKRHVRNFHPEVWQRYLEGNRDVFPGPPVSPDIGGPWRRLEDAAEA